ncbi:MAG: sigma-70 family RNA polymerase sigma factor [Actinomycetota bacterium]|nr:sigma-70 family RNA polymerase sigma factor [Actinomycetota bacterium]
MTALPADDVLVVGLRSGDEATFARLLDSWSPAMLRLARAYVSTSDSAAEVVQDTWLAVIKGIGGFEGRSSLRTWVFRILTNIARTRGAKEKRTVPWSSLHADDAESGATVDPSRFGDADDPYPGHWREFPAPWRSPESSALDAEIRTVLHRALAGLPARQRIVVELRDVEGYTTEEVCAILGLTPANQRVLLHRGRSALRATLEGYLAAPREEARGGVSR